MKTENKIVFAYILGCIQSENYDVVCNSDTEKLQFLADTFKKEYCFPDNLKRYGSYQNIMTEWIMGLPSCFNVDFENYRILEIAKEWGTIDYTGSSRHVLSKLEDKVLDNWFNFISAKTFQLFRKHKITFN
jgi:hypothetical protein